MDYDSKLYALETRQSQVSELKAVFIRCKDECSKPYARKKRKRLMNCILQKFNDLSIPHGFKRTILIFKNEVLSVKEGLSSDVPDEELQISFDSYITECDSTLDKLAKQIQNAKASIDDYDAEQESHFESMLERTKTELSSLEKLESQEIVIRSAPVIPIADNSFLSFEKLSESFKCDELSGYAVLHSQTVIGINKSIVKNIEESLEKAIKKLEAENATHYILIMNRGIQFANMLWFWVMTEHDANNFRLAFTNFKHKGITRTISIRDWGFANAS